MRSNQFGFIHNFQKGNSKILRPLMSQSIKCNFLFYVDEISLAFQREANLIYLGFDRKSRKCRYLFFGVSKALILDLLITNVSHVWMFGMPISKLRFTKPNLLDIPYFIYSHIFIKKHKRKRYLSG